MDAKHLTILSVGVVIVILAYIMKKQGIEGFQSPPMAFPAGTPMVPGMGTPVDPATMTQVARQPMAGPVQPPQPGQMAQPAGPIDLPLPGQQAQTVLPSIPPPQAPMAVPPMMPPPQPEAVGMQPNQQQITDLSSKIDHMSAQQNAIFTQLQQMTQSFKKEGFQSNGNPYNVASPGDTQAMEFRLGKKALVDTVIQYA